MLGIDDVLEILSTPLLGVIAESDEVLRASNLGSPITLSNPSSAPARAYFDAARRLKASMDSASRFVAFVEELTSVIGHADRATPLRDYCSGLLVSDGRRSVERCMRCATASQLTCSSAAPTSESFRRSWDTRSLITRHAIPVSQPV
jgi:hypothetical protein